MIPLVLLALSAAAVEAQVGGLEVETWGRPIPPEVDWRSGAETQRKEVMWEGFSPFLRGDIQDKIQWRVRLGLNGDWSVTAHLLGSDGSWTEPSGLGRWVLRAVGSASAPSVDSAHHAMTRVMAEVAPEWRGPALVFRSLADREEETARRKDLRRRQEREPLSLPGGGFYPDLLGPTQDVRGVRYVDGRVPGSSWGNIEHVAANDGALHHFRYFADGEAVSGLILRAKRVWGGSQTATIDRVYTHLDHRRMGHAAALMDRAQRVFRRVHHSRDLTDQGKLWKKGVR